MRFMNDMDLIIACRRFNPDTVPNRVFIIATVVNLMNWTNNNSDGWAYWPKPVRAASKALELIESTTNAANRVQEENDATDAQVKAALTPIKRFLTSQGVNHDLIIPQ